MTAESFVPKVGQGLSEISSSPRCRSSVQLLAGIGGQGTAERKALRISAKSLLGMPIGLNVGML
jgi:hypothetical protein